MNYEEEGSRVEIGVVRGQGMTGQRHGQNMERYKEKGVIRSILKVVELEGV